MAPILNQKRCGGGGGSSASAVRASTATAAAAASVVSAALDSCARGSFCASSSVCAAALHSPYANSGSVPDEVAADGCGGGGRVCQLNLAMLTRGSLTRLH
jgi:hypothetical protein